MSDQPLGIDETSYDLPPVEEAAERVKEFLRQWGDGRIDESDDPEHAPLYARDLEVLSRHPEHTERAAEQARADERERLCEQLDDYANARGAAIERAESAEAAIEQIRTIAFDDDTISALERGVITSGPNQYDGLNKDEALAYAVDAMRDIRDALDGTEAP